MFEATEICGFLSILFENWDEALLIDDHLGWKEN